MQDTDVSRHGKEMDKKYPFGLLVFINLTILPVCFVLDVLFVDLNDYVILVPIFLQLVQVWVNYLFTHGGRRMLKLDLISFLAAVFGVWMMIQSYDYMYSNYPAREDPVVSGYVVLPWLLFEFLMISVIQLRYFQIKRKKLLFGILLGGILIFLCFGGGYLYALMGSFPYEGATVSVYDSPEIADHGNYEAYITLSGKVVMRDRGKKIFTLTQKVMGLLPEGIALGNDYFYIYGWNDEDEQPEIMKLDYNSRILFRKKMERNILSLVCQEGVLYIGSETEDQTVMAEKMDRFYADYYLVEKDFETGEPKACEADAQGVFRLGNTVLYDHGSIGFSMNPRIPEYSGTYMNYIHPWEEEEDKYTTRWTRMVKDRLKEEGLLDRYHMSVNEYQQGTKIFGTINVYASSFLGVPNTVHMTGISYRIDCKKETIEDWKDWGDVWMILNSADCVVYQEKTRIMRENLLSEERECLAECEDDRGNSYKICGNYLGYYEGEKRIWVRWNKDTF
ncbi:MAG: hypothetical protein HFG34_04770 [Eubacterium sp.]|nr:hypothetical protein [Eubacterium sp.]